MGTPAALHAALKARLDALATVDAYAGTVPTNPPADAHGRVAPYAVIWASGGHVDPDGRALDGAADGALTWPVQITVAAGDPDWCLGAVGVVRAWLDGHELVAGAGPLREEPTALQMQRDDKHSPPRWYVPLLFRCQTP